MSKSNKNSGRSLKLGLDDIRERVMSVMPASVDAAASMAEHLRDKAFGYDQSVEARERELFNPSRQDWDTVSLAALNLHVPILPDAFVPRSHEELEDLLKRLMSWDYDQELIEKLEMGWGGDSMARDADIGSGGDNLTYSEDVAAHLWSMRHGYPEFFHAAVTGRLAQALELTVGPNAVAKIGLEKLVRIMVPLTLIWCAFDVQRAAATARYVSTRPLEAILKGPMTSFKAATTFIAMKAAFAAFQGIANGEYRTREQRNQDRAEGVRPKSSKFLLVRKMAKALNIQPRDAVRYRRQLDAFYTDLRSKLPRMEGLVWNAEAYKKPTSVVGNNPLSTVWYAGLHPLQVVAIPVIRLVEAEQQVWTLVEQIAQSVAGGGSEKDAPFKLASDKPSPAKEGRERHLIHDLRRTIVLDDKYQTQRASNENKGKFALKGLEDGEPAAYDTFRKAAREFIKKGLSGKGGERATAVFQQFDLSMIARLTQDDGR